MKKIFFTALCLLFTAASLKAETLEGGKFLEDVLISDDIKMEESSLSAKEKASRLLQQNPKSSKSRGSRSSFVPQPSQSRSRRSANRSIPPPNTAKRRSGLSWGATYNQTKALGVDLERIERKDSVNDFIVTKLPKPISDFRQVVVSFGENNSLWRINGYGRLIDDDASASKVLFLYRKYYKLLERKYGNAQEFFTPKISAIEKSQRRVWSR